jgi:nitrite reductase/ring-hydroxylating ferredoxin subunit
MRIDAGSATELRKTGRLLTKLGSQPVCVLWDGEAAYAVDDRCPHLGFPLHRGTVEQGMVTCHWHHARFDLTSGCTLDPFADDVRAYDVEIDGDRVFVVPGEAGDTTAHLQARLVDGLEQGLTLVIAKAVLGLLDAGVDPADIVRTGVEFGCRYRRDGWGAGLTVLVAMANLLPQLSVDDGALALVHGLAFVARDTANRPPRFPLDPLGDSTVDGDRLTAWYRRFVDTRSDEAAERTLATAVERLPLDEVARMMLTAVTDHVFIDGGHTVDFTNKAFEALDHLGPGAARDVLPSLVLQTAGAERSEEFGSWRHPHDLPALIDAASHRLAVVPHRDEQAGSVFTDANTTALAWQLLGDEPGPVVDAIVAAHDAGASAERLGRALALAAALRITRFHVQNDHGDWDVVHHGFTAANALHQCLVRSPSPLVLRGLVHGALRVYLDRFLNVPAARLPATTTGDLAELQACWDEQGNVDRAGAIVYGFLRGGGTTMEAIAALGHALLAEDAEFHWFQVVEAAARQAQAWPEGSEESALILAGTARFLAAHTPTRRELPQVVRIAARLRRGEVLFEEA